MTQSNAYFPTSSIILIRRDSCDQIELNESVDAEVWIESFISKVQALISTNLFDYDYYFQK